MLPHHARSIENLTSALADEPSILALILGGSLAHGFARPDSDIDVTLVVSSEELSRRRADGCLHFNNRALCTYDGYIDGKYVDVPFLEQVAARGSDPIRYAYEGNRILLSRVGTLESLLEAITRFPLEQKQERLERFSAQLLA